MPGEFWMSESLKPHIYTSRLTLRRWQESDLVPFSAMNADPEVMAYLPKCLTPDESNALIQRIEAHFDRHGFGLWAVEQIDTGHFMGFVGLLIPGFQAPFTPCVEIGWRLARPYWGQGYATEAAKAVLEYGFTRCGLSEIVSFTVPMNTRSRDVMQRLGMTHSPHDDFNHPSLPEGHPLRPHVLYRLSKSAWNPA